MADDSIEFIGRPQGWRPSWAEMISIVERFCRGNESLEELHWVRTHPADWLLVARYMRKRIENHIAESRKSLRELPTTDPVTGRPYRQYLDAKREMDNLNRRRLHFLAKIDEQIIEARYLLGTDRVGDQRESVVANLIQARQAILSDLDDETETLRLIELVLVDLTDGNFDPDAYRPRT